MLSEQDVVLTSVEQYLSELAGLPVLSRDEEAELVRRARLGDREAKESLLQGCLRYVASVTSRYACYLQYEEYLDLVSIGNLAVVERLDKALTVENPVAYLYGVAKLAIRSYCYTHSQLITQVRGRPMVWTDSLDAPLCNRKGCLADLLVAPSQAPQKAQSEVAKLYAAINALTPKQQYVILRSYGLDGDAPESIASISRRLSPTNPKVTIARNRYNNAIMSLRRKLLR
jgi:DNA-directed RNA polymerase sigma subunit (sigma70/sigma32)